MEKSQNSALQNKQTKPPSNQTQQKYDSIIVAREIILGQQNKISKWLFEFKQFKNPNYQKFTQKVHHHLKNNNFSFSRSVERFIVISKIAGEEYTTFFQMQSILKGFDKFWKSAHISQQSMRQLLNHIVEVYNPMSSQFTKICRELIQISFKDMWEQFKKIALDLANVLMKSNKGNGEYKAIAIINEFNLFTDVSVGKVIQLLIREPNTKDILNVFIDSQGQKKFCMIKMFIDSCVANQSKNNLVKCQKVIKQLQLNPNNYPNYIIKLLQKYISYQLRTYKLFNIQLIIKHDLKLIHVLIGQLRREKRIRDMKYFIVKYELQKEYNLNIDQRERQQLIRIKNVLTECDYFGPTEVEVLQIEQNRKKYLYVKDFDIEEKDIIFVNKTNLREIKIDLQFKERKVGIDSQRSGGMHVFDNCQTEIVQIYTGKRVIIFDYMQLQKESYFKQIFIFILTQCKIFGQDIQKELREFRKEMKLPIQDHFFQQVLKTKVIDSSNYFKQIFPKQTKSNLAYMSQVVFDKNLSKYEQCSGWKMRPLRKAQLHYAALDCIVPLKLCEQLSKNNKK